MDPRSRLVSRLVAAWAVVLCAGLSALLIAFGEYDVAAYRALTVGQVALNVPVVAAVFLLTTLFLRSRVLRWKPSDLLFRDDGSRKHESLITKAMRVRYVGPVVALLLLANLPMIAVLEELIFRDGTKDWRSAAVRSLLFGLAHLTTNVPLGASLAIGATGFWFSFWYFRGGLEAAAAMHFGYVLIILGLSVPALLWERVRSRRP